MKFNVPDMSCGLCKASITEAIGRLDQTATVDIDLATKTVTVASQKSAAEISDALDDIGFTATVIAA